MKSLLELRNKLKKKKPHFVKSDCNVKPQFENWRKPRGIHNKRRLNKKGHQKNPSIGYSSPKEVRGLTKDGYKPVLVKTFSDLEKLSKGDIIVISSKVGLNKKIILLEQIKKINFPVLNVKDIDKTIQIIKESLEVRKKYKKLKSEKRDISKKEAEKKKKEKEEKGKTEDKQKELSKEAKIETKTPKIVSAHKEL